MTLERLKELSQSGERRPDESLAEWADRFNMENAGIRNEALPILLELAEAGDDLATAVREWAMDENNTTINDCTVLAIRYQQALAALEVEE